MESELIVEDVHSFSMFVWPGSSSTAVITCRPNARFEFRNVSAVTVSGLEFVGCFENHVTSIRHFKLENSVFLAIGNGLAIANGTVLSIQESTAMLNSVVFLSTFTSESADPSDLDRCTNISTTNRVTGILLKRSNISITQSLFEGNDVGYTGAIVYDEFGSDVTIFNTTFVNNSATKCPNDDCSFRASIVHMSECTSIVKICHSKFVQNNGGSAMIFTSGGKMQVWNSNFIRNTGSRVLYAENSSLSIGHSALVENENNATIEVIDGTVIAIDHTKFINNNGSFILEVSDTTMVTVTHCEFLGNTVGVNLGLLSESSLLYLDGAMISVSLSEFVDNRASYALVNIPYYTSSGYNISNIVFHDNTAAYEVFIRPFCRQGFSLSLGSSRCIQCSNNWLRNLIGIVAAASVAGIALVVVVLVLNLTVAVGTLNGILFYANIVEANADTYFLQFRASNFATVLISWLNLNVGIDVCFVDTAFNEAVYKALLELAFPSYVITLVVIVIVASECSSKFAKVIGKGNPVAVLATMILLSYAKFFNAILAASSSLYFKPAYGSRNVDVTSKLIQYVIAGVRETHSTQFIAVSYILIGLTILLLFLCVMYTTLMLSWQWLLRYQDKAIFRWVRYQKLRHFLEPYLAPYCAKYRYWTGLMLLARVFLYLISFVNFSLNPRVDLMAIIFVAGGLIFFKGVIANRVYKSWPLDVVETAIYFNLVAFSALTWYNLDFGGNQVAVAYTSVMIIFVFILGVIVFHVLRYTRLYKCSFVEKAFEWTSSKLYLTERAPNDVPEELDGYRLVRSAGENENLPTVITHTSVEIKQTVQNQE